MVNVVLRKQQGLSKYRPEDMRWELCPDNALKLSASFKRQSSLLRTKPLPVILVTVISADSWFDKLLTNEFLENMTSAFMQRVCKDT